MDKLCYDCLKYGTIKIPRCEECQVTRYMTDYINGTLMIIKTRKPDEYICNKCHLENPKLHKGRRKVYHSICDEQCNIGLICYQCAGTHAARLELTQCKTCKNGYKIRQKIEDDLFNF